MAHHVTHMPFLLITNVRVAAADQLKLTLSSGWIIDGLTLSLSIFEHKSKNTKGNSLAHYIIPS